MPRALRLLLAAALLACVPAARAAAADVDRDGLDDAVEDLLLGRFAPVVLLHPAEAALPGSTDWLLARSDLEEGGRRPRVLAASVLGLLPAAAPAGDPAARLHLGPGARQGSPDPRDWTVYGHAFPAAGGGVLLQYWFFYPFNDAFGLFDHEGDWEHVTVRLGPGLRPEGAHFARHADSAPGPWFPWSAVGREGEHPVVRAARGTHASYPASGAGAPRWDRLCPTGDPARAAAEGCAAWRTWASGTGGVVNLGERRAPRVGFLEWPGRWGATGGLGMDSRAGPPPGPAFQHGWCTGGAAGCG